MRDIARAVGVSVAGLLFTYLPSKQTALYLVCERIFDDLERLWSEDERAPRSARSRCGRSCARTRDPQYSAPSAVFTIENAPELHTAERRLDVYPDPGIIDIIVSGPIA
jgi:AcrR family transcriptional regulator